MYVNNKRYARFTFVIICTMHLGGPSRFKKNVQLSKMVLSLNAIPVGHNNKKKGGYKDPLMFVSMFLVFLINVKWCKR